MGPDGEAGPRSGSTVISIVLPDRTGGPAGPEKAALGPLSGDGVKMFRERADHRWTGTERRPRSAGITVDQLSITGMALVFNPAAFWLRRAIWLAIIVCLLVWLCVQLRLCVLRLTEGGTVRTWSRRTVTDIPLPAVTVCHGNRFKKSVVLRHQPAGAASWPSWHRLGYQTLNWSSFDGLDQFYAEASYGWDDMVLFCIVDGRNCKDIGTFRRVPTLLNGLCTTFNTNATVTRRLTTSQVTLVLEEKEPLGEFEHSGWQVFLHPQDVRYNDVSFLSGLVATVKIYGNRMHQVNVQRAITDELPHGSGDGCNSSADALAGYQRCIAGCLMGAMQQRAAPSGERDQPPCAVPWVARHVYRSEPPSCRTMADLERSSMGTHNGVSEQAFVAWSSRCRCPLPCRMARYRIQSQEKWHIEETSIYLAYPEARGGTHGSLMLWLSEDEEVIVEREAYSANSFISDVGGNLGLMLGGSLLTFVEIVDCVIASCLSRREKRARVKS
ncbi:acid-sensing ion channel 3-like [Amphibalanus amphitrite]|uniref:acid-sensing ion channel 3-like n=1 Tax=Amphibalanus amphitrite TaxID=1232801 RepID=UPI001C926A83|nr:acid-sensing ion channel 3-like [Amphibalanus amphitrite]